MMFNLRRQTKIKPQRLHEYQSGAFSRCSSRHGLQVLLAAPLMLPGRYAIASLSETHRENTAGSMAEYRRRLCLPPSFFLCVWSHIDSCYHAALALLGLEESSVSVCSVAPSRTGCIRDPSIFQAGVGTVYISYSHLSTHKCLFSA